jgi:hypothetical protein
VLKYRNALLEGEGATIVSIMQTYGVIQARHVNHPGINITHQGVHTKYANISRNVVQAFTSTCDACNLKPKVIVKQGLRMSTRPHTTINISFNFIDGGTCGSGGGGDNNASASAASPSRLD